MSGEADQLDFAPLLFDAWDPVASGHSGVSDEWHLVLPQAIALK